MFLFTIKDADMRTKEFISRTGEKIYIQVLDIDGGVGGVLDRINIH